MSNINSQTRICSCISLHVLSMHILLSFANFSISALDLSKSSFDIIFFSRTMLVTSYPSGIFMLISFKAGSGCGKCTQRVFRREVMGLLTLASSLTRNLVRKLAITCKTCYRQAAAGGLNSYAAYLPALTTPPRRSSTTNCQRTSAKASLTYAFNNIYYIIFKANVYQKILSIYFLEMAGPMWIEHISAGS